jgi:hypothetical protein
MATKEEITFDEQSFMWDFIDIFKNVDADGVEIPYKNFIQIKDSKPSLTLNKINGQAIDGLEALSNSQLAALVPKMRLFKVVGEGSDKKNIEYPFNKFTNVESIVNSALGRGTDVGIQSVTMRDVGTNPFNVGVSFEGDLTLFFQSFEAIFKERNVGDEKLSFAELLDQPRALGKPKGGVTKSERPADNAPNFKDYKIRLEIGWHLPRDPEGVLGFTPKQKEQLENLTRSYILQNADQTIDINQQDASVTLKIKFYAGIEGQTLSTRTDILYIDEKTDPKRFTDQRDKKAAVKELSKKKGELIRKMKDQEAMSQPDNPAGVRLGAAEAGPDIAGNEVQDYKEQIKDINKKIETTISESRSVSYGRLLDALRKNLSNASNQSNGKIRYVDISAAAVTAYKKVLVGASQSVIDRDAILENDEEALQKQRDLEQQQEDYLNERSEAIAIVGNELSGINQNFDEDVKVDSLITTKLKPKESKANKINNQKADSSKNPQGASSAALTPSDRDNSLSKGSLRIHYFYLGDLIESIFHIIYKRPTIKEGNTEARNRKIYEELKMILGPFSYYDPLQERSMVIQMADIPISFSYFNAWFYDNVVKRQLDNYVLRDLLRDLCAKLLTNVISPGRIGVLSQSSSYKIRVQSINVNENSELNDYWIKNESNFKERLDINKLKDLTAKKGNSTSKKISEWLYMYIVGDSGDFLAKEVNDSSFFKRNNIPRYYIGGQTGLIKNISFARTQIPYKFEQSLTDESKPTRSNLLFQDKYDAKVELFGNPTLKPGMLIYLDPRGLGLGDINTTNKSGFQYQLGIGGYYRVVRVTNDVMDGMFTTSLETIAEFDLRDIQLIKQRG